MFKVVNIINNEISTYYLIMYIFDFLQEQCHKLQEMEHLRLIQQFCGLEQHKRIFFVKDVQN